jgi:hypothetical protein
MECLSVHQPEPGHPPVREQGRRQENKAARADHRDAEGDQLSEEVEPVLFASGDLPVRDREVVALPRADYDGLPEALQVFNRLWGPGDPSEAAVTLVADTGSLIINIKYSKGGVAVMGEESHATGLLESFLMILMAEIGDKTFLMVMLLPSKSYKRCVLWDLAETMMNMVSVSNGAAVPLLIPKVSWSGQCAPYSLPSAQSFCGAPESSHARNNVRRMIVRCSARCPRLRRLKRRWKHSIRNDSLYSLKIL